MPSLCVSITSQVPGAIEFYAGEGQPVSLSWSFFLMSYDCLIANNELN